ncbi:unnamed protein product [Onchocerca flexuosa]|uniref:Protein sleepless n=1 Tax=Onchocerca flexuosa TaxID=387005 RepID=A0A183H7P6_9BILA|nr:unnamed protein product [Onchocerca flexuosa]
MNTVILTLTSIWLLSSFSTLIFASITCMSCATKHAVTHWNKFMNYRVINSRTGTLMDDHSCENPQNLTCNAHIRLNILEIFPVLAMAQGCSVGLFDGGVRCFDRPIIWRGRGGNFNLDGHYCLCDGDLCNRNPKKSIQYPTKFYAERQKIGS